VAEEMVYRVIKQPVLTICDPFSEEEPMDTRTLLIIASMSGLVLFSRHRARRRFNRSVDATITKTQYSTALKRVGIVRGLCIVLYLQRTDFHTVGR